MFLTFQICFESLKYFEKGSMFVLIN